MAECGMLMKTDNPTLQLMNLDISPGTSVRFNSKMNSVVSEKELRVFSALRSFIPSYLDEVTEKVCVSI